MAVEDALAELKAQEGQETHVSEWLEVSQDMINEFAKATGDMQWIHTNPERAQAETPYAQPTHIAICG